MTPSTLRDERVNNSIIYILPYFFSFHLGNDAYECISCMIGCGGALTYPPFPFGKAKRTGV
jgi:hypothetical protein